MQVAAGTARTIVAEINSSMPFTYGDTLLDQRDFVDSLYVSQPLPTLRYAQNGPITDRIGTNIAHLVADGDTLEIGYGSVPTGVLRHLTHRRDLGIHTGLLTDDVLHLIELGVITNRRKQVDTGSSVTCLICAQNGDRLYQWANANPSVLVRSAEYVLADHTLAQIDNFCAVNGALEVDLSGQVNSEIASGRSVGGVGGLADFVHGALRSIGGRSIIALPSTARGGTISRIVSKLRDGVVTLPRYDADIVVTEWGIAELRGRDLRSGRRR